jgi:dethiobiotin synthetase
MSALPAALRQSLFIAGTDTGVGKTWVARRLLAALGAATTLTL